MTPSRTYKIVFTGGPCSGKTTLLAHFARLGYPTVPEAALMIIQQLNREMGVTRQCAWRRDHLLAFQHLVWTRQLELEKQASEPAPALLFLDRGLIDGMGYLQQAGIAPPLEMVKACRAANYGLVFLLHTLSNFQGRTETGRGDTLEYARRVSGEIHNAYTQYGHSVIELPEAPIAVRASIVLEHLPNG